MDAHLRDSGIEVIGQVPWGIHLCQFYQDPKDLFETAIPYLQAGIAQGEYCIWVVSEPLTVQEARDALEKRVPDLVERVACGQVFIVSYTDWYLTDGQFDIERVLRQWRDQVDRARRGGYEGLRVVGDSDKFAGVPTEQMIAYEREVCVTIGSMKMLALCTYSVHQWLADEVVDVVNNHHRTLLRRDGRWVVLESAERSKIRRMLAEQQERVNLLYSALISLNDGVLITDRQNQIVWMNPTCERLGGYTIEESLGKNPRDLYGGDDEPTGTAQEMWKTLHAGAVWRGEMIITRKDGTTYPEEMTITPVQSIGYGASYFVSVKRDITERRKAEQAQRERQQERHALAEALRATAVRLTSTLDSAEVLQRILKNVGCVVPCRAALILQVQGDLERAQTAQGTFWNGSEVTCVEIPLDEAIRSFYAQVMEGSQPVLMGRELVCPITSLWDDGSGPGDCLTIPLTREQKGIAALSILSQPSQSYDDRSIDHLQSFANQASMALENARLYEEKQRHVVELELLGEVSRELRKATKREEIIDTVLNMICRLLHTSGALLCTRDPLLDEIYIEWAVGSSVRHLGGRFSNAAVTAKVFDTGQVCYIPCLADEMKDLPEAIKDFSAVCAPLTVHGQPIGAIWTGRKTPFSEYELDLAMSIIDIAANALNRSSLFEETLRLAQRMEVVNRVGQELSEIYTIPGIFTHLGGAVAEILPELTVIETIQFDPYHQVLNWLACYHNGKPLQGKWQMTNTLDGADSALRSAIQTRSVVMVSPARAESTEANLAEPVNAARVHQTALYVPVLFKGQVLGVIHVSSDTPRRLGQAESDLLSLLATTAGIALENARLFSETQLRLDRLTALHSIDEAINSSLDLDLTLRVLLDHVTAQLKVDCAGVLLLDPITQRLEYAAGRGFRTRAYHNSRLRVGEGASGDALLKRKSIFIDHLPENEIQFARHELLRDEGLIFYGAVPLVSKGEIKGLLEIFHRSALRPDAEWRTFFESLADQAVIAVDNSLLFNDLQKSNTELEAAYDTTLLGWMRTLELRDDETEGHTQRVTELAVTLGRAMGLSKSELINLRRGALLHDIGKIGIPDHILRKPGPLDEEEWQVMRTHPIMAYQLLEPIDYLRTALDIPYCHHERWDGSGYPRGLKGKEVSLAARIFAVADVWDALLSDRPYRDGWPISRARQYLAEQAGVLFDPKVVETFFSTSQ